MARQTSRATLLEIKRAEPSQKAALTPVGWRLRAAMLSSVLGSGFPGLGLGWFMQGGFSLFEGVQDCSVMSGRGELGVSFVSKWQPPPHQAKPRKSPPLPWTVSEMARVLLVPSVSSAIRTVCL